MHYNDTPFPDLFVIGAQKSGTTSLCAWLDQLEGVSFSKPKEPMLISRDEVSVHPHYFTEQPQSWQQFHWPEAASQYQQYFTGAPEGSLLADGSTSYLYSQLAPKRIAEINPNAKIIIILRDPAQRTYSAYQHYLRHGTSCESFEQHIQFEGGMTIEGSEYARFIKHWLQFFPREQFHFMLYESLKQDRQSAEADLLAFLGLEGSLGLLPQENTGKSPYDEGLQRFLNRRISRRKHHQAAIAHSSDKRPAKAGFWEWLRSLNLTSRPYGPMDSEMRRRLNRHFMAMNADLPELTGLPVHEYWYK